MTTGRTHIIDFLYKWNVFKYGNILFAVGILLFFVGFQRLSAQVVYSSGDKGIAVLEVEDGKWVKKAFVPAERPMYLAVSPDGKTLACAVADSAVQYYSISPDGSLASGKRCVSGGKTCCHVSFSHTGKTLYAANYTGGNFCALEERERLCLLQTTLENAPVGQVKPHPHYAAMAPNGLQLAVCDLGLDRIFLYPLKDEIPQDKERTVIQLQKKAGPRHLLFSPNGKIIYSANELDSTVTVFRLENERWTQLQTLPATENKAQQRNYPGAIRYSENGAYIFVTNRGAETVAVFAITQEGLLERRQEFSTASFPSDVLQFGSTLLIACRKGNCVELRGFNCGTGAVSECLQSLELAGANSLVRGLSH